MEFLSNYLSHLFYFVIGIGLVGFVIYLLNVLFYKLVGNGRVACYASGLIGTPVHELSHALMCIIFRHKITDMKLYQMDDETGTMGYVTHSYNERSIYQKTGLFFIGVAPIIGGSLLIYLCLKWLLPTEFAEISLYLDDFSLLMQDGVSFDIFTYSFAIAKEVLFIIFTSFDKGINCIVFLIIGACIALHMKLSGADIKGALPAIPIVAILIAVIDGILYLISFVSDGVYYGFSNAVNTAGVYLFAILLLSLCLSVVCIVAAAFVKLIKFAVSVILHR